MLHRIKNTTVRLCNDQSGASLLEYSGLIGLIVAGVVASIVAVATWTGGRWGTCSIHLATQQINILPALCGRSRVCLKNALMH